jgi:hypothetical protein
MRQNEAIITSPVMRQDLDLVLALRLKYAA